MNNSRINVKAASYSVNFNLKQQKKTNEFTQIVMVVTSNGIRVRSYTGLRTKPSNWCKKSQRCLPYTSKNKREFNALTEINRKLNLFLKAIESADEKDAEQGNPLSVQSIRKAVSQIKNSNTAKHSPIECLSKIVDEYIIEVNRRGHKGISSTQSTYKSALSRLLTYDKSRKIPLQSLDDFDSKFFSSFTEFLYSYRFGKKLEKKYTQNTVVNTLKVVKNLLHRAYDKELTHNDHFKRVQTTLPADVSEPVYLTEEEIARIASVPVKDDTESLMRDAFIISCYTALRISDIYRLHEAEITKTTISMYQSKTKEKVVIPILKEISELVQKYQHKGFPKMHSGTLNHTLRELARKCKIDQSITYRETRGGEVLLLTAPKYQRISFHTARRSCVTNLYKRGYPVNYIMSLSGHRSIQAFQRYMRASSKEMLNKFFNLLKKDKAI